LTSGKASGNFKCTLPSLCLRKVGRACISLLPGFIGKVQPACGKLLPQ
jgi:hypothetical protein